MRICTIITPDWVETHLVRWVRYVRQVMPDAELYLVLFDGGAGYNHGIFSEFRAVHRVKEAPDRWQLNSIRMRVTELFGVDGMLYLDADCDVLGDLSLAGGYDWLACVKSPVVHVPIVTLFTKLGYGIPKEAYNNGLLWLNRSWFDEYEAAWETVELEGDASERIMGTVAFNLMLKQTKVEQWQVLPYEYGVIWWDVEHLKDALVIQYCNDAGQQKRLMLERKWRDAQ